MFFCLEWLKLSGLCALMIGCNCSVSQVAATKNAYELLWNCHSPRKMSGHNKDTEMRIDWQMKGRWVGGTPAAAFLLSGYSFQPGLFLHHGKFCYESVLTNFISFNMTAVSSCQLHMTVSESCLAKVVLLSYPIYFGEKSAYRSFVPGKMTEYRKNQQI